MKTLVQIEDQYRGLLEAAPDGMVVVNRSGEIVLLNLQAERQFGYARGELVGQQVSRASCWRRRRMRWWW
jgi:PAS domain S-box-containing protein